MLHSVRGGDQAVYPLPHRSKISERLRGEDKQIPRRGEAAFQRDEISRLCRADDADSPGCDASWTSTSVKRCLAFATFLTSSPGSRFALRNSKGYRRRSCSYYASLRSISRPRSSTLWCIC